MNPKRILIYLHAEQASWLVIDEIAQTQQTVLRGNLADLTPLVSDHEIQVIVPGQSILLTAAKLPKLSSQRLKQALPFALEEQLIDDVNNLHFATGEYQPDNSFPVAVVAKEKMDTWLAILKQANIIPHALIPATLALPFTANNGNAFIDNEIATVRTGSFSGFACDKENLSTFLELQLSEIEPKIEFIHLYNFSASPITIKLDATTLNEMMLNENQLLEHLMKWTAAYPFINLLQGPYQTTQKATATKKIWIIAACLALAWISFAFFSNIGSFFILHHATAASEQSIEKIYKRNFPQASTIVAPRQRMEEKLKKLSSTANKNTFLSMLGILGNHLPQAKGIQLLSLDYRGNQLTLGVTATTFENLDIFTQALTRQNLHVKQQSAGIAGTSVKANLLITQGVL